MDAVSVDLCIKFGIQPMAQLAWDTVGQLDRYLLSARRLQVTVTNEDTMKRAGAYGGQSSATRRLSLRAIAYVRYDMDHREFTSGNLAEALWAGTTMSFMIDWWYNVGSYLASFSALRGVTSINGVLCRREVITGRDEEIDLPGAAVDSPGLWRRKAYSRTVFTTIPMASLPDFKPPTTDLGSRLFTALEVFASLRQRH